MNRNPIWKPALIILLVIVAIVTIYPLDQKLKPGIDLGGGSSMIFEIDTEGLDTSERKGMAQRMIPILRRRIDPKNLANIVMRPLGDKRIEIQLPLASKDTVAKREAYVNALDALEVGNENLMKLKRYLSADEATKNEAIDKVAADSEQRRQILQDWVKINQERDAKQQQRNELGARMEPTLAKIKELGANQLAEELILNINKWYRNDKDELIKDIADFSEGNKPAEKLAAEYVEMYSDRAPVINELARPETGLNAKYSTATQKLQDINLSIAQLTDTLELAETSTKRQELLDQFKTSFPDRSDNIDKVIAAFKEYRKVGGRLDDPEDIKRMLKGAGVLEFRILPTTGTHRPEELEAYVEALKTKGPKQASDSRFIWVEIEDPENFSAGNRDIGLPAIGQFGEKFYVLASDQPNETMLHTTGEKEWKLKKAYPTTDQNGRRAIGFNHDEVAAKLFWQLTNSNIDTGRTATCVA